MTFTMKRFSEQLTQLDKSLPLLLVPDTSNNIPYDNINKIILHDDQNSWAKQSYIKGLDFKLETFKMTTKLFSHMETPKKFYKGVKPP